MKVRTTSVDLHQDFPTPFNNGHNFMIDQPEEGNFFLCLKFVLDDIPLEGHEGGKFIPPFMKNRVLEDHLLSNQFPFLLG